MPVNRVPTKVWTDPATTARFWVAMEEAQRRSAGSRVRELRKQRGWSGERLAAEAGVSSKTVSRFENGAVENPRDATLQRVADALGKTIEDIAGPRLIEGADNGPIERLERIEAKLDRLLAATQPSDDARPTGLDDAARQLRGIAQTLQDQLPPEIPGDSDAAGGSA